MSLKCWQTVAFTKDIINNVYILGLRGEFEVGNGS